MGVHSGMALVLLAKLSMVAIALVGVYATIRIAERLGGSKAGLLAGLMAATFPASLIFGHSPLHDGDGQRIRLGTCGVALARRRAARRMFSGGSAHRRWRSFFAIRNAFLVAIGLLVALLVSPRAAGRRSPSSPVGQLGSSVARSFLTGSPGGQPRFIHCSSSFATTWFRGGRPITAYRRGSIISRRPGARQGCRPSRLRRGR